MLSNPSTSCSGKITVSAAEAASAFIADPLGTEPNWTIGDRLTRAELIEKLSLAFPQYSLKDIDLSVHVVLDKVSQTLANGDRVEIRGFGSFALNLRPPRMGRNPKTGVSVHVPAKYVPHFKVGKELRERVNSQ